MIITSFVRGVYPLKYPNNACLSCLDTMAIVAGMQLTYSVKMSYVRTYISTCLTSKQVSHQNKILKYIPLKHQSIAYKLLSKGIYTDRQLLMKILRRQRYY